MQQYAWVLFLAVAGFLIGGVYATWKTAKGLAVILALGAVLAFAGAATGAITWAGIGG